jgi:hypothetical protein
MIGPEFNLYRMYRQSEEKNKGFLRIGNFSLKLPFLRVP